MKMKGFVKVTKKDANTGEELYESDWIENIIYDANFTSGISAMSLSVYNVSSGAAATAASTQDPYIAYYQSTGANYFTHYMYANDHYEAAPSSTIRSQPSKFWQFQKIQGTPFALVEGNGQTTTPTLKFTQQLLPPTSGTRDIHTIGWTQSRPTYKNNSGNNIASRPKPRTAASFTPAITQSTTEILVVVYKIEFTFPTSSTTLSYDQMSALTWLMAGVPNPTPQQSLAYYKGSSSVNMNNSTTYTNDTKYSPFKVPLASRRPNATYVAGKPNTGGYPSTTNWGQLENNASFSGHRWDGIVFLNSAEVQTTDTNVGDFVSSISVTGGGQFDAAWVTRMIGSNTNKTQQYYGKVSGSTVPFFSAGEIPNTDATLTLDTAPYSTTIFPELWSIDLGGVTGGVGTAEYSLRKRYVTGYVNNTLVPRIQVLHDIQENNIQTVKTYSDWGDHTGDLATSGRSIKKNIYTNMDNYGKWVVPGSPLKLYEIIEDNVHFYNLESGENSAVNILQYPAFTATTIGGHAYDEISDTLWLACQDTGLWKIASPYSASPTISNLDLSSISDVAATVANNAYVVCLGLAVGGTHRTAWAMMNGALAKSTDNGATWVGYDSTSTGGVTFTQATIEGKWAAAMCMVADKNTDNKLLVLYETSPNSVLLSIGPAYDYGEMSGVWWDSTSDTTQLMSDSGAIPIYWGGTQYIPTTARVGFGAAQGSGPPSRTQLDDYTIPWFRRNYVNMVGCTRTQSHWYISHLNTNQNNYLSGGTNRNAPVLLTHGTQIGPAGAGYTELLGGDTYNENFSIGLISTYAFPKGPNSGATGNLWNYFSDWSAGIGNWSYWQGHTEHVDDDGNDCIIKISSDTSAFGTATPTNMYKFTFTTSRMDNIVLGTWTGEAYHQTQYIGRGLLITCSANKFYVFSLSDGTIEGVSAASKMAGDVWQRYVWTGSIWRLRTSDADPLTLKSTHGTTDALIGGATISFDDAGSTQSFVSGEAISAHVVDGIVVDSATSVRSYSPTLSMWDNEIVTEVTNGTIASSTPSELLPVTYYDNVESPGINPGFNTDVFTAAWGSAFVIEDTRSTTAYYNKQGSGGRINSRRMNSGWSHGEYPEFRSRLGFTADTTMSSAPIVHVSTRYNSSEATTGDLNLETHLLNPEGQYVASSSSSPYVRQWGLLDHRNQDDGNNNWKIETAFGLVNAASYTDGASPAQGVLEEAEILYGFKVIPGKLFDSLMTNYSSSTTINMQSTIDEGTNGLFTINSANISEMMNEGPQSTPMTIQIIESGSVVFTQPAGDRYYSVISLFKPTNNSNLGFVNTSLTGVTLNNTNTTDSYLGNRDLINDRYCPFNIERVGTTVKYYLRDKLIYTSLASSSENLMPAVFTSFATAVSIVNSSANTGGNGDWGHMHGQVFKKSQTDFFVKVGTSGSSNGAFNSNFLYLQTSVRESFSIKIDGVEATVTGLEDNGTLNAGEVSVFPRQGLIRCSSADAGKTVTVSIPCAYRS